jgi:phenylalanyl-tRNA synthetase alpha chain
MKLEEVTKLKREALEAIKAATSNSQIEELKVKYLGRKNGLVTKLTEELPKLSIEDKRTFGPQINDLKKTIQELLDNSKPSQSEGDRNVFDVTQPAKMPAVGHFHPTTQVIGEIKDIFRYLGFSYVDGPEVELDLYNFQKLRLYPDHPARDNQQTYYLTEDQKVLLRTHTSNMQVRYMEKHKPPLRILSPGRVYRRDQIDATHLPAFYQLEGLLVDEDTKMTDLIGVLDFFAKRLFGKEAKIRIYGHNFPYTEPSIELEVYYPKLKKWVELLGAGMVHPEVLENAGIDSKVYRGWAFGMGPERIAMLKYGIEDIRHFYSGDLRFLTQF